MQNTLSLILNMIFLIVVIVAIWKVIQERRRSLNPVKYSPSFGGVVGEAKLNNNDDIIAVRKIMPSTVVNTATVATPTGAGKTLMLFLAAKEDRQFLGYELLQTVLSVGLRFGEGHLFHKYQNLNGQNQVICSLAAATSNGTFDLQNIGAFNVRGLCLFMKSAGNSNIDSENLALMYATAKQLSERLDAHLLDDMRNQFTHESLQRY